MDCSNTKFGFKFGNIRAERLWSHKGASCVRLINIVDGTYVDLQTSPKGKKSNVQQGVIDKSVLKSYLKE